MSRYKFLLRCVEALSLFGGVSMFVAGVLVHFGRLKTEVIESPILAVFMSTFIVWFIAILLTSEFIRLTRKKQPWLARARGLNTSEMRTLVQWCPRWLLISALTLAAISFAASLPGGKIVWNFGEPLSSTTAVGLCFGLAIFNLLAAPVLASASRMPGEFADQQDTQDQRATNSA